MGRLAIWVGLFWSFTYILLSARAQLLASDQTLWMSGIRLVSTTTGSLLYALGLCGIMQSKALRERPALLALYVVASSGVILAVRYLVDQTWNADIPSTLAEHVRWVLVWAGYFGLWLSVFVEMDRRRVGAAPGASPTVVARPAQSAQTIERVQGVGAAGDDAWSWVVDAFAEELAKELPATRTRLMEQLRSRAPYEWADNADGSAAAHNARAELLNRLTHRLS